MDVRIYNLIRILIICVCICLVSYFLFSYIVYRDISKEKEHDEHVLHDVVKLSPLYED